MSQTRPSTSNPLSRLQQELSSYVGYETVSARKQSDQCLRTRLLDIIHDIDTELETIPGVEGLANRQRWQREFDNTRRKLTLISASLEDPEYEDEAFFRDANLPASRIQELYHHEWILLHHLRSLLAEICSSKTEASSDSGEDIFIRIENLIDGFNQSLFEREALIISNTIVE